MPLSVDTRLTPRDDGDLSRLDLAASVAGIRRLRELHRERAARGPVSETAPLDEPVQRSESRRHCGAGASTLAIDPFGNVYRCVQWHRPIGNLYERSIAELWKGSRKLR